MINRADPDQKPTDLDLYYLQRRGISEFSRTMVNLKTKKLFDCALLGLCVVIRSTMVCHMVS